MKIESAELKSMAVRISQYPEDDKPEFLLVGRSNVGKSSFINTVHNANQKGEPLNDINLAASFQASVTEVLVSKTLRAAKEYDVKQLLLAGGVAANKGLRDTFTKVMAEELPDVEMIIPPLSLCGDNAAMIGAAAFIQYQKDQFTDYALNAKPGLTFN